MLKSYTGSTCISFCSTNTTFGWRRIIPPDVYFRQFYKFLQNNLKILSGPDLYWGRADPPMCVTLFLNVKVAWTQLGTRRWVGEKLKKENERLQKGKSLMDKVEQVIGRGQEMKRKREDVMKKRDGEIQCMLSVFVIVQSHHYLIQGHCI